MWEYLSKEIKRQGYMDLRYKAVDEMAYKADPESEFRETGESDDTEMKYQEEGYTHEHNVIFEELGFEPIHPIEEKKEN
jgi:hypothetical protein